MPRTAPVVDGTSPFQRVSFHWIDYTGDQRSDSLVVEAATTAAAIEAAAVALGAASHANLWKVEVTGVYEGDASKTNAETGANNTSVFDNIVALVRNTATRQTQNIFIPAPEAVLFDGADTDVPDTDPAGALATTIAAVMGLLAAAYNPISARFTERREINTKQKF